MENTELEPIEAMAEEPDDGPRGLSAGEILRLVLMALFVALALWTLHASPWARKLTFGNIELFRAWLRQWGGWAWAVFIVAGTALVSIGFPRLLLAFIAGTAFGVLWGTVLAQVVTTLAAIPAFYYTYFLGREMIARRMGRRLQKFDAMLKTHGFMVMLLIRLCPVGNAFLTNCAAGVSSIPFRTYLLASCLGFFPQTFIFSLTGAGLKSEKHFMLYVGGGIFLLLASSLFFLWYFRHSTLARSVFKVMRKDEA